MREIEQAYYRIILQINCKWTKKHNDKNSWTFSSSSSDEDSSEDSEDDSFFASYENMRHKICIKTSSSVHNKPRRGTPLTV